MKRSKWILYALAVPALILLPLSCATTGEEIGTADEASTAAGSPEAAAPVVTAADTGALTTLRQDAEAARKEAVAAKAPRAVPEKFEAGEELLAEAAAAEEREEMESAGKAYQNAAEAYRYSAEAAGRYRQEALAAMSAADEAIARIEQNADDAVQSAQEETI